MIKPEASVKERSPFTEIELTLVERLSNQPGVTLKTNEKGLLTSLEQAIAEGKGITKKQRLWLWRITINWEFTLDTCQRRWTRELERLSAEPDEAKLDRCNENLRWLAERQIPPELIPAIRLVREIITTLDEIYHNKWGSRVGAAVAKMAEDIIKAEAATQIARLMPKLEPINELERVNGGIESLESARLKTP